MRCHRHWVLLLSTGIGCHRHVEGTEGPPGALGTLRRSWGHRDKLKDFPGKVGTLCHGVTPPKLGHPFGSTPVSPPKGHTLDFGTPQR